MASNGADLNFFYFRLFGAMNFIMKKVMASRHRQRERFLEFCKAGDLKGVKDAITSGADVNQLCEWGRTGLILAVARNNKPLVSLLLGNPNIDVNAKDNSRHNQTAFFWALSIFQKIGTRGGWEILQLFLSDPRVDKNIQDNDGYTPLTVAVFIAARMSYRTKIKECVKVLLSDDRVDPNIKTNSGDTALLMAIKFGLETEVAELLISDNRTKLNLQDDNGVTPLLMAVEKNETECVKLLLRDRRVDPNIENHFGDTPLMMAVEHGRTECVQLLISNRQTELNMQDDKVPGKHRVSTRISRARVFCK